MEELEKEFMEFLSNAARIQGMDSSIGAIFGALFMEPEELSMEELAKKTGYSTASICVKAQMLEPFGFIKRVKKPHTKKAFFCAEKDFCKIIKSTLIFKQQSAIRLAKEKLPQLIQKYKSRKLSDCQKKKLGLIERYYEDVLGFEIIINEIVEKIDKKEKNGKKTK
ncbi:hypothetical protein JXB28_02045 [Candidatus Woesearchaeota archaeon]|nr:hypothetical protein [Candidatus Woesearchaeota archaeon]